MTAALCLAAWCRIRGRHHPDCPGDCDGCLPRQATDGAYLCALHTRLIAEDAVQAAELHTELELRLSGSGRNGERTSGTPDRSTTLDDRTVDARTTIRAVLTSWARLIADERGIGLPADDISAIGAYVARHAEWLAATDYAGEACDEMRDLVRMAWPLAYPTGARVFDVAACPHDGCGGTIKAILRTTDSLLPSSLVCDQDPDHEWSSSQWLTLGRKLQKADAATVQSQQVTQREVTCSTTAGSATSPSPKS